MSDDFQAELRLLGIVSSPASVRQPEGSGCIERFFRALKEQLLWVRHFTDVDFPGRARPATREGRFCRQRRRHSRQFLRTGPAAPRESQLQPEVAFERASRPGRAPCGLLARSLGRALAVGVRRPSRRGRGA